MVQMSAKVLEHTSKFVLREYGPGAAYSLEYKILCREIFAQSDAGKTLMRSIQKIRDNHPGMPLDLVFQRVWNRYVDLSTPLLFEPGRDVDSD